METQNEEVESINSDVPEEEQYEPEEIGPNGRCSCGTKDQAIFWCFVHGYLVKPPVVRHKKAATISDRVLQSEPVSEEDTESLQKYTQARCSNPRINQSISVEYEKPACVEEPSSPSDPTPSSVLKVAEDELASIQQPENVQTATDNQKTSLEPTENKEVTDGTFGVNVELALLPVPEENVALEPPGAFAELSVARHRRRHDPWAKYVEYRPISVSHPAIQRNEAEPPRGVRVHPIPRSDTVPAYVKNAKSAEQGGCCVYCERAFGSAVLHGEVEILKSTADHFIPRKGYGRTVDSNIYMACHICNRLKSTRVFKSMEEARIWLSKEWEYKGYKTANVWDLVAVASKWATASCSN
jgi:5-methylcytosine-specific restriction endonuclease McrA